MTAQQLDAVKSLAKRFGSTLAFTDVLHDPQGLPKGWVSAIVREPYEIPFVGEDGEKHYHKDSKIKITAGVSPAGSVHT